MAQARYTRTLGNGTGTYFENFDEIKVEFKDENGKQQEITWLELRPFHVSLMIRVNDQPVEHYIKNNLYVDGYPFIIEDVAIKHIYIKPLEHEESGAPAYLHNAKFIYLAKY